MLIGHYLNKELQTEDLIPERQIDIIGIKLENKDECTVCFINLPAHYRVFLGKRLCHIWGRYSFFLQKPKSKRKKTEYKKIITTIYLTSFFPEHLKELHLGVSFSMPAHYYSCTRIVTLFQLTVFVMYSSVKKRKNSSVVFSEISGANQSSENFQIDFFSFYFIRPALFPLKKGYITIYSSQNFGHQLKVSP